MPNIRDWQFELTEYIKQREPGTTEKSEAWKTAIGLQDVDNLKTSEYLLDTAKEHIEGKIDIDTVQSRVKGYYEQKDVRTQIEADTKEADIVSARITALLVENTFQFSPAELKSIHKRLFNGIFENAGQFRKYNISKKELVLKDDTVIYASYESINDTLDYDFKIEKDFSYEDLPINDFIKHISKFVADIWQIHPFCEGNTRTTAVFIIKYLKTFGFHISNEVFSDKSWYFRNALVRANYSNIKSGIHSSTVFLEEFFANLLTNQHNELKNRFLHIDYGNNVQSANPCISKCNNCTFDEISIINAIRENPSITQKMLSEKLGKSERTIKTKTVEMQQKGLIERKNGKRNGVWEVLIEI